MELIIVKEVGIGYSENTKAVEEALEVLFCGKGHGTVALQALSRQVWSHIAGKDRTSTKEQVRQVKDELIETLKSICSEGRDNQPYLLQPA